MGAYRDDIEVHCALTVSLRVCARGEGSYSREKKVNQVRHVGVKAEDGKQYEEEDERSMLRKAVGCGVMVG